MVLGEPFFDLQQLPFRRRLRGCGKERHMEGMLDRKVEAGSADILFLAPRKGVEAEVFGEGAKDGVALDMSKVVNELFSDIARLGELSFQMRTCAD